MVVKTWFLSLRAASHYSMTGIPGIALKLPDIPVPGRKCTVSQGLG